MFPVQITTEKNPTAKADRKKRLQERLQRQLALVGSMPDEAAIDIQILSILLSRSIASIWRDVKAGRIAPPFKAGPRSTRWKLGDVRSAK